MSFMQLIDKFESFDFKGYFNSVTSMDVQRSLNREVLDAYDLLNLLSDRAQDFLEDMAQKSRRLTLQNFGRTIGIYAPLYISDYCTNHCIYCGFNCSTKFKRTKLTLEEIEQEAQVVAGLGIRHILFLTGEAPAKTPMSYLEDTVRILKKYFSSIAIEIFPMDEDQYRILKNTGVDSLTVYQETYDRQVYKEVHPKGKKANYEYRLLTPERGAKAGFRAVNIGPLFGLGDPAKEAFFTGLHAKYLEHEFPDVDISLSLPRMREATGAIKPKNILTDRKFVQFMAVWRLFMPRAGINISTRESADFRDQIIHLGVTRYSAGSKTDVGGYSVNTHDTTTQFDITDTRSVAQTIEMIRQKGYQPIFKDWEIF